MKLIKAIAVKNGILTIPKIHDLNKLSRKASLEIDEELGDELDIITSFNIEARYPDYKREFYKKCTKEFTVKHIDEITKIRLWLSTKKIGGQVKTDREINKVVKEYTKLLLKAGFAC